MVKVGRLGVTNYNQKCIPVKLGMALGARKQKERQDNLWIAKLELPTLAAHSFYEQLNGLLESEKFDAFAESACQQYYAEKMGRPGRAPGI